VWRKLLRKNNTKQQNMEQREIGKEQEERIQREVIKGKEKREKDKMTGIKGKE
jgi:hypothetical protein